MAIHNATVLRELTSRGGIYAFTPPEAGIRFSDPGGMQG